MRPGRAGARARRTRVAIALGSNLGERRAHLRWAVGRLRGLLSDLTVSPFEDTAPVEVDGPQPRYLNAVAVGWTTRSAEALLVRLLALERERGRVRRGDRPKAPRRLDLDLILYGSLAIDTPALQLPHPRFRDRPFVLDPLAGLAPRWRDPVTGLTMAGLKRTRGRGEINAPRARRRRGAA